MKFQSKFQNSLIYYAIHEKIVNFFINKHNVKHILSGTYFCPNSTKIENQAVSTKKVTKKEEPLNLNLAGQVK